MPRISEETLEDVRRLSITDIIGKEIDLIRRGRETVALCPFHSEKTPSFHVREDRGLYHCFGCGKFGGGISFIMERKSLPFMEAVVYLAESNGIPVKYDGKDEGRSGEARELKNLHEAVAAFAYRTLCSEEGLECREYLEKRGIDKTHWELFGLGFIPKNLDAAPFERQFGRKFLTDSGIFFLGNYGLYTPFAGRLIIPIRSPSGSCIAFSGRILTLEKDKPKYYNSKETLIFQKRRELYNSHNALSHIKGSKSVYIVEGYFAAMRMVINGFSNTVAAMGTAFTAQQIRFLKSSGAESYTLIFDGDEAGKRAMLGLLEVTAEEDIYPSAVFLPEGLDPDDFIVKYGADKYNELLSAKTNLYEYRIREERERAKDEEERFNRLRSVRHILKKVKDPYRLEHYIAFTAQLFGVKEETLSLDLKREEERPEPRPYIRTGKRFDLLNVNELNFISYLTLVPEETRNELFYDIPADFFEDEDLRIIYEKVVALFREVNIIAVLMENPDLKEFALDISQHIDRLVKDDTDILAGAYLCKNKILLNHYENNLKLMLEELKNASGLEEKTRLLKRSSELRTQITELAGRLKEIT